MNPEYDYKSWKNRLSTFHNWWGRKFEQQLEQIFKMEGEILQRQPELETAQSLTSWLRTTKAIAAMWKPRFD